MHRYVAIFDLIRALAIFCSRKIFSMISQIIQELSRSQTNKHRPTYKQTHTQTHTPTNNMAPPYRSQLCRQTCNIEAGRQLRPRSATRGDLDVPRRRLSAHGRRSFSCAGPAAWNSLPDHLKTVH